MAGPLAAGSESRDVRDAVLFHLGFAGLAAAVLASPAVVVPARGAVLDLAPGWRLLALVAVYNAALPLVARVRGHRQWAALWAFLAPLSVFQVVPEAFLAGVLGSLRFPDTGGPRLGPVPLAMAGMWTVPLWLALWGAGRLSGGSTARGAVWAGVLAGAVLVGAEATLAAPSLAGVPAFPVWHAVGVRTAGPVALYVVAPEVLLGAAAWLAFRLTRPSGWASRVGAAALVSLVYLGALAASFGLVERALG